MRDIQFGLRFSPAICAIGVGAGTAAASPLILSAMMATAVFGAVTPRHPFDLLYNSAVRHALRKPSVPRNGAPRRFSCGVAAVWLAATIAAFLVGAEAAGYALGAGVVFMAAFVAITHICLPSLVYLRLFGHVRDVPQVSAQDATGRLRQGAAIIDLRDAELFRAGHAPSAVSVRLTDLEAQAASWDRETPLLVICQTGVTSLQGVKLLRAAGFMAACSVRGGMASWLKHGLPLEHGGTAT